MLIKSKGKNPVLWKAHARTLSKPRALQMYPIARLKLCPIARPKLTSRVASRQTRAARTEIEEEDVQNVVIIVLFTEWLQQETPGALGQKNSRYLLLLIYRV
jgi:hypothetical protein